MFAGLRSRLTYANVVSTLCLFIVLGGSAYAAAPSAALRSLNNSLQSKDLRDGRRSGAPTW